LSFCLHKSSSGEHLFLFFLLCSVKSWLSWKVEKFRSSVVLFRSRYLMKFIYCFCPYLSIYDFKLLLFSQWRK
jgi:hypothetical protein